MSTKTKHLSELFIRQNIFVQESLRQGQILVQRLNHLKNKFWWFTLKNTLDFLYKTIFVEIFCFLDFCKSLMIFWWGISNCKCLQQNDTKYISYIYIQLWKIQILFIFVCLVVVSSSMWFGFHLKMKVPNNKNNILLVIIKTLKTAISA